jgi:hypothetical protein
MRSGRATTCLQSEIKHLRRRRLPVQRPGDGPHRFDHRLLLQRLQDEEVNKLPIKTVGEPLVYSLGAAVVPKNSPALLEAMNKAINDMVADGTLQKLADQHVAPGYDMVGNMKKGSAWK